jgi:hypothetical protein
VIQCGDGLSLSVKSRDSVGIVRKHIRQNFDRDIAIEPRIACAIHLAHSAFA